MPEQIANSEYTETLAKDGVVIIEDFVDSETCDEIRKSIQRGIEEDVFAKVDSEEKPILNERGNPDDYTQGSVRDEGMLDIEHIDRYESKASVNVSDEIREIIERAPGLSFEAEQINSYVNRSVTNTRDYHADTVTEDKFKSFIYLSDVPDPSYGPYSYVRGTHELSDIRRRVTATINGALDRPYTTHYLPPRREQPSVQHRRVH